MSEKAPRHFLDYQQIAQVVIDHTLPSGGSISEGDLKLIVRGAGDNGTQGSRPLNSTLRQMNQLLKPLGDRVVNSAEVGEKVYYRTTLEDAQRIEQQIKREKEAKKRSDQKAKILKASSRAGATSSEIHDFLTGSLAFGAHRDHIE